MPPLKRYPLTEAGVFAEWGGPTGGTRGVAESGLPGHHG